MKYISLCILGLFALSLVGCKPHSSGSNGLDYDKFGITKEDVPFGLKKGDRAPVVDLVLNGVKTPLADLYKEQIITIFFYRGHWCPACNTHLAEFTEKARNLSAKGIKLIAITPEKQEGIDKMREATGADFLIVSDVAGALQKAFDVDYVVQADYTSKIEQELGSSLQENNATNNTELPVPATFVIDRSGQIVYSHFDVDYTHRASVEDILNSLD